MGGGGVVIPQNGFRDPSVEKEDTLQTPEGIRFTSYGRDAMLTPSGVVDGQQKRR